MAGVHPADDMSYPGGDRDFPAAAAAGERGDLSGLRVAYSADGGFADVDPDVRRAFAAAVARFADTGATPVAAYPATGDVTTLWELIAAAEGERVGECKYDRSQTSHMTLRIARLIV